VEFKSIVQIAANDPRELRAIDVDRVMNEADVMNVHSTFKKWLLSQDLQDGTRREVIWHETN